MKKENEENEIIEELEEDTTPPVEENNSDEVADILTSQALDTHIKTIVDEKLALAQSATDNEEEPDAEDEDEEEKGLGMFPIIVITGVVIVGFTAVMLRNRPNISHEDIPGENHA
jgi:hypothetical protein